MKYHLRIDKERCKGCALCMAACARSLLKLSKRLNALGHHFAERAEEGQCVGCQQCAMICPEAAIEMEPEDAKPPEGEARIEKLSKNADASQTWAAPWPDTSSAGRRSAQKPGVLAKEKV
jgi:2-oxoglutarate ferredoxin oxidoreductase subunit delta